MKGQMQTTKTLILDHADLNNILATDERLLWSGAPGYGRRFFEVVGHERLFHIAAVFGILVMWSTLLLIYTDAELGRAEAIWVYGAITLALVGTSLFLAGQRQHVLSTLAYFITDKRAVICRRGWNWRFRTQLYVVSFPHASTYPYSIIQSRPYPSLQVGTLLSVDQVQPFGWGLSHPGHSLLRHRTTSNVTFDYVPNAAELLSLVRKHADTKN